MTTKDEHLDRALDALLANRSPSRAALRDPEVASLVETARSVCELAPVTASTQMIAIAPSQVPARPARWRGWLQVAATLLLLAAFGIGLGLVLPRLSGGRFPVGTGPVASTPTATAMPTGPSGFAWSAAVQPVGGVQLAGGAFLIPTGTGDFEASVAAYSTGPTAAPPLTWLLAPGACAESASLPTLASPAVLRHRAADSGWSYLPVEAAALAQPLVLVVETSSGGVRVACVDLPVAAARARQPVAGSAPLVMPIQPGPAGSLTGQVTIWTTPSGDRLLRAEVSGPPEQFIRGNGGYKLLWHLVEGACAAWLRPS